MGRLSLRLWLGRLGLVAPLVFFANGMVYNSLFARMPDVAAGAGLSASALGLVLAAIPVGVLVSLALLPALAQRAGAEGLIRWSLLGILAAAVLAALSGPLGLVQCLVAFGFGRSVLEYAQNQYARLAEARTGRSQLARAHSGWSFATLASTLLASGLVAVGTPVALHVALVGGAVVALTLWAVGRAPQRAPRQANDATEGVARLRLSLPRPDRFTLILFVIATGFGTTENVIYTWGLFYLREDLALGPSQATMLYAGFTAGMIVMRVLGDGLRDRVALHWLVAGLALCSLCGLGLSLAALGLAGAAQRLVLVAGLALLGLGVALNGPLMAKASLDHGAAESFAAMSGLGLLVGLVLPVAFGVAAERFGYGACLALCAPALLLSGAMALRCLAPVRPMALTGAV